MRAARHKKQKPTTGQQALLEALWGRFGNPATLEGKLHMHRQNFINWRIRKGVPLVLCYRLARELNVNPYALNYKGLSRLNFNKPVPTWKEVVNSCHLSDEESNRLIDMGDNI